MLSENIIKLKELINLIRTNPGKAYPWWVFELESISRELMNLFKKNSKELKRSGKLQEEVPELNSLRQAILKLSSLAASGGWSISLEFILQTITSTINDLEDQIGLNAKRFP